MYGAPPNKQGALFNICQDVTSRAAYKYNINSMISFYVSTSGVVPAYRYNINSMVSLYVSTSGLVPACDIYTNSMVSLLLELQSFRCMGKIELL